MEYVSGLIIGGRWVLDENIGSGGEAQVWKAHSIDDPDHVVAIKLRSPVRLSERGEADAERENQQFVNEKRQWLEFSRNSVNVVIIKDIINDIITDKDGEPWIVRGICLEYSELGDLHEKIKTKLIRKILTDEKAFVHFLLDLIAGVRAGHEAPMPRYHCDIKPKNILLFRNGAAVVPKLTDFGVAQSAFAPLQGYTPGYSAPEVTLGSSPTAKSDVFSLGVTFYELYTALVVKGTTKIKPASDFKSGKDFVSYLKEDVGIATTAQRFTALSYANLFGAMVDDNPELRPSLARVSDVLNSALLTVMQEEKVVYQVQTQRNAYLWNPEVHHKLGEKLHYFLIKGANPTRELGTIEKDIQRLGYDSFALRTVVGAWDYVVRIWLPNSVDQRNAVHETLQQNDREVVGLEVLEASIHKRAPPDAVKDMSADELLAKIERTAGEDALKELQDFGFVLAPLNRSEKLFRVTLVVMGRHGFQDIAKLVGGEIKITIARNDKLAKEISYYNVRELDGSPGFQNIILVVTFLHSNFIRCRNTLLEVFRQLAERQTIRFRFATLLDMNANLDRLSDDGSIISKIQSTQSKLGL